MILALLACAPIPLDAEVTVAPAGLDLQASLPVDRVEVMDASGTVLMGRDLPTPTETVYLGVPLEDGETLSVAATAGSQRWVGSVSIPVRGPLRMVVEAPPGVPLGALDGERMVPVPDGEEMALLVTAREAGVYPLRIDGDRRLIRFDSPGARRRIRLPARRTAVSLDGGPPSVLTPRPFSVDVEIVGLEVPVGPNGEGDPSRPRDRVRLPARWWEALQARLGLGIRPPDNQAPWAHQAVHLHNRSTAAVTVVVKSRVDGGDGVFRPRLRDMDGEVDAVTALLRIAPGERATAVVPLYVDRTLLEDGVRATRIVEVSALGQEAVLDRAEGPLVGSRGGAVTSLGLLGVGLATLLGWVLLLRKAPQWLGDVRTPDMTTIAVFGAISFVVSTTSQLVGMVVAAGLGPFAPLLTGMMDDALRMALLATLLAFVPRPGTATLVVLMGWVLRALALGMVFPLDWIYLPTTILFLEGSLWIAGITRETGWRESGRMTRWVRLGLGLSLGHVLIAATALLISAVFYRLFYAAWYVALMLALPGFLYVWVGAWVGEGFARSLAEVAE